jgi:hypothetical protein
MNIKSFLMFLLLLVLVILNVVGISYCFDLINIASTESVVTGFVGLLVMIVVDFLVLKGIKVL